MIPDKVSTVLAKAGLKVLEFEPGSTPTAPLAAARIGVAVGQIAKSLLFRAKNGSYHLVVYPAAGTDATGVPTSYEQLIEICGAQRA